MQLPAETRGLCRVTLSVARRWAWVIPSSALRRVPDQGQACLGAETQHSPSPPPLPPPALGTPGPTSPLSCSIHRLPGAPERRLGHQVHL